MFTVQVARGVPLSTLCPKFLHANSTSHTWPFSAVAELIDNAYDPDVDAKQIWIDKTQIKDKECLTFMDDGNGLNYHKMHRMLSFGYSDKKAVGSKHPIGRYGNGFKSGSMRLGLDVIVLSKSEDVMCVGMLSQSYLTQIGAEQITVPIISIKETEAKNVLEEHRASLQDILRYSLFNTEEELFTELQAINANRSNTGTRIIIWNLGRTSAGNMEYDFTTDRYDIRIPSDVFVSTSEPERAVSSVPESTFSLRAYCSVLYLKPRMQINIRGLKVKTRLISKSLACTAKDAYKPTSVKQRIPITFGYNTKSEEQYGIMMYHKNRLIKAYHRVGCQLNASNVNGIGVIGVIECNFLEPTHNKQDFENNDNYRKTISSLATKLEEYCKEIQYKRGKASNNVPVEDTEKSPDQNWVQCSSCQQWRKLPDGINTDDLPENWFCNMNPDPQFRRCEIEEELADSDSEQPMNQKTYKKQEREDKKMKELKEQQKLSLPKEILGRQGKDLQITLRRMTAAPETPQPRQQTPQEVSACSPSTSSSHPVITNVFSLSKTPSRMKRRQPTTPQSESKRPKLNGVRRTLDMYTRPISLTSSPLTPAPREDANNEDDSGSRTASELSATGNDATEQTSDISTAYNDGAQVREEGSDITQAQEQQNQLLEHLQSVSYERDALTDKVTRLLTQLTEVEERQRADCEKEEANKSLYEQAREKAEELTREKEALLEASQAHAGVLQQNQQMAKQIEDFKCQLNQSSNEKEKLCLEVKRLEEEKAREKAEELTREKEALLEASQAHARVLQQNQQMAKQIEDFKCQLNQSSNEKEKLCLEVKRLEEEKASISAECEQIRITMEEQATFRERDATTQTCARGPQIKEEAGEAAESSTATSVETNTCLVELRHNVARLLLRYVPLELDQVNYECNVIDEILEQYLCSVLSSNSSTSH